MLLVKRLYRKIFRKGQNPRDILLRKMPKNSICAEIGVYKGNFSAKIIEVVQPAKLHLIDPWIYEEEDTYKTSLYGGQKGKNQENMDNIYQSVKERFQDQINPNRIVVHRSTSLQTAEQFEDNYFDWVYIDGNHLYEFVKKDLETYYKKVKAGGYITGDDYGATQMWWEDGVKKAVDEFRAKSSCKTVLIQGGQFILQKL
ncbi:class I SAM-dependent methyltransferase [Coleofasciculus sp. F4-SAH-05]|uniref:class I SAM-dependent methyltransferase n=1 Tax=Coleofasciculus sp. F4-SAH-05 TaxID=3069525 RepID=UPI0032F65F11